MQGGDANYNVKALIRVLNGEEKGPHRDALLMGASLVLEVSQIAEDLEDGMRQASAAIDNGATALLLKNISNYFCENE